MIRQFACKSNFIASDFDFGAFCKIISDLNCVFLRIAVWVFNIFNVNANVCVNNFCFVLRDINLLKFNLAAAGCRCEFLAADQLITGVEFILNSFGNLI